MHAAAGGTSPARVCRGVTAVLSRDARRIAVVAGVLVVAAACGRDRPDDAATPDARGSQAETSATAPDTGSGRDPVTVTMRRVHLRLGHGIALDVDRLHGRMISQQPGRPPVFDDQSSYVLDLDEAEVSMSAASIAALLNHRVFAVEGASVDDLEIRTRGEQIELKGDLNKGIDIPFTMRAELSPAGGTRLRLRPVSLKTAGIPAQGLLHFFGLELEDLVDPSKARGIATEGDDLLLDAAAALPPPQLRGTVRSVRVSDGRLIMSLGPAGGQADRSEPTSADAGSGRAKPPQPDANYIFFSGSDIRFGKLTMHGADLELVDADPSDPFDFSPSDYHKQLVAGYSKTQPDGGLVTVMPDYDAADRTNLPAARSPRR